MINRAEAGSRRRRCPFSACLWARPARAPRRPRSSRRSCRWGCRGRRSAGARLPRPGPARPAAAAALRWLLNHRAAAFRRGRLRGAMAAQPPWCPPSPPPGPQISRPGASRPELTTCALNKLRNNEPAGRARGAGDSNVSWRARGWGLVGSWEFLFGKEGDKCGFAHEDCRSGGKRG